MLGVGQLIAGITGLLEQRVGRIWVSGEISNLHRAASGHFYFTLKDEAGQMRAALFRGNATRVRFDIEEGLEVVAEAEVSIYAARGDLQLIVRQLEPCGVGALQLAFEQLRKRLQAAGLFDEGRKRPISQFPRRIGVVTSPTSAALRDVLKVASRRFPATAILISPTLVQGEEAPQQIAAAIGRLAAAQDLDAILIVRGGGSLEDLWAFNSEVVAQAIADSPVPIVSGVGHETDLTIADLVADLRAPTPSAAVMQVLPDRRSLASLVGRDAQRLGMAMAQEVERHRARVETLRAVLRARSPRVRVALARTREARARVAGQTAIRRLIDHRRRRFSALAARLDALSPLSVLGRGYGLVRRVEDGRIVRRAADVALDDELEVRLAEGAIGARVTRLGAAEELP
ncbi:MAG: exodeoxyribonuclease VII large subunit [bacterium]|nr:exodeoxyribonuclease VII large subunit [Deltaproteobacteria bacterium]MCP4907284.1 exodeoxyribonuclease VII large subunit [bacterium]